jgi:hypothetical protein
MLFRNWAKLILLAILTGGFLVPSLGTANPALAQEPDVDISVAYGWWQVVTRPDTRLLISKNRLYDEWDMPQYKDLPLKIDWMLSEGRFTRLGKNRYLFTIERLLNHPQGAPLSNDCRYIEFQLHPSDLARPPKRMEVTIEPHKIFDKEAGFSGSCGGPPAYWPDWVLRKKLAKQK